MNPKPQQQHLLLNTNQCCLAQFFSHNSTQDPCIKKNPSGLINPYSNHKSIFQQNELVFPPKIIKPQFNNSKRSISSMKPKKRANNRCTYEFQEYRQFRKDQYITQKIKSPLRNSQAVQRYFSPKPQLNTTISRSQLEDKKKIQEYFNVQNIQNKGLNLSQKHPFFKKEKLNQPIQFSRNMRQSNPEPVHNVQSNIKIGSHYDKADKIQQINKDRRNTNPNVQTPLNVFRLKSIQKQPDLNQNFLILNSQNKEQPKLYQRLSQNFVKQQNPTQINVSNSIHLKLHQPKTPKQILQLNQTTLQKICEMSKQQSRHQVYIQAPMNPFQNIESFVMEIRKENGEPEQDQKQYDSIKTKGRPVESMLQMTKDLTKTRKHKKQLNKRKSAGLNDMDNMTVTSQFDEDSHDDARERIQESAVLLNFFNPPTHLRDRMELSRASKQIWQEKSGF